MREWNNLSFVCNWEMTLSRTHILVQHMPTKRKPLYISFVSKSKVLLSQFTTVKIIKIIIVLKKILIQSLSFPTWEVFAFCQGKVKHFGQIHLALRLMPTKNCFHKLAFCFYTYIYIYKVFMKIFCFSIENINPKI